MPSLRNKLTVIAAIGAAALGGSVVANAATSSNSTSSTTVAAQTQQAQRDPLLGGHVGPGGEIEKLLTGDTAAKVKAAAEAKVSGGTVLRVENDADSNSPYEAHVRKADGSEVIVLVNSSFEVTSVDAMGHP